MKNDNRPLKLALVLTVAILVLALDQLTKSLIKDHLKLNQSIPVIKGIFHITYVRNTGIAFGLLKGHVPVFQVTTLIILTVLFFYYLRVWPQSFLIKLAIGLICGGALSNFIDRLYLGQVIDFLDFRIWPVFNFADMSVVIGAALLVISYSRGRS